jgi:hypothetical protein
LILELKNGNFKEKFKLKMQSVRGFLFVGWVRRIQDLHKNTRNTFRTSSGLWSDFDFKK